MNGELMTEQQIRDGYARLEGTLAPPLDVAERVERRMTVRRRRRRAGVVTGTLVAVVAVGGGVVAATSGDDGPGDTMAVDRPEGPVSTLVMTRPDGSTYAFPDVTVSCEPPETAGGDPIGTTGRIWMYSPMHITGSEAGDDAQVREPFVYFEGIVAKLQKDRTFELPVDWPGDSSRYPITLFMADTEGAPDGNEVASSAGGSGTVRVLEAACDPVPVLRLEVDATLGSEENKQSLDLAGALD
ncbi:hypothetical protein [Nocardioides sp. T2.26MG-1]|uniref:hypothetical protein n=1 Tax=Nocardioides sp. T2.26MG-1 TaxID=3041166 RepID=UPI0024778FA0|nr:hypothetical protein [Nocardioides sp. T2.26MG-1]CAI9400843.1 hypothetical protein HIDPHFAB_00487 [Nocardioides sp. T2.26MG-1]